MVIRRPIVGTYSKFEVKDIKYLLFKYIEVSMANYPSQYYGEQSQIDPNTANWFNAVDADRSGEITAKEIQKALVNVDCSEFSDEACRMMIDLFGKRNPGAVNINEFSNLFQFINQWKATFERFDSNKNGFIEFNELVQAFQQMGYRFTPMFVQNLIAKYDSRTKRLTLDDFIIVSVHIQSLTDGFRVRDPKMKGKAKFQYEDFLGLAMGLHK